MPHLQLMDLIKINHNMPTKIESGSILTVNNEIINHSGQTILEAGQKVIVRDVDITPSRWSNVFDMYMPEKLNWVELDGIYGIWSLSTFKETH